MEHEVNQINVIPLVDVMLVLLVIVLTTATFISTGQIPVNLAKAKEAGDHKDVPVVVTLTATGDLFLNDRPVPADGLKTCCWPTRENPLSSCGRTRSLCWSDLSRSWMRYAVWDFQSVSLEVVRL